MKTKLISSILASVSACTLMLLVPCAVTAAESTSYRLYENNDAADSISLGSNSFTLNEAGETWTALPITSSNFQIVTAPPAQQSSESSSSTTTSSSSASEDTGGGGAGGGRGNRGEPGPSMPTTSSSDSSSSVPLDANVSDQPTEPSQPSAPSEPSEPSLPSVIPTTVVSRPLTQDEQRSNLECGCTCQECPTEEPVHCSADRIIQVPMPVPVFAQNPVPSLLMLIAAFGLGYFSKTVRPGSAQVSKKKKSVTTRKKK